MQQAVEIAAKLYQCRKQQIFLGGEDKFRELVAEWKPLFDGIMQHESIGPIPALHEMLKRPDIQEREIESKGLLTHLLCAVACELAEPTVTSGESPETPALKPKAISYGNPASYVFSNAIIYRLTGQIETARLEEAMADHAFAPCGSQEMSRYGWVPAAGDRDERLAYSIGAGDGDVYAIRAMEETKILPSALIKREVDGKVAEIEHQQARKVYRRERNQLKDEVVLDLLPRAFPRQQETRAIIMPQAGLLVVEAAGHARAEKLLTQLRSSIGSLPIVLPDVKQSPSAVMSHWLEQQQPMPAGFQLLDEADLKDNLVEGGTVKVRGQDLTSSEVVAHLEAGKRVVKLGLEWDESLRFQLHEDLRITRIRQTDQFLEGREEADDEIARFEADLVLTAITFQRLHRDLMSAFGGEATSQGEAA